jgi:hypothetical protein
MSGQRTSHPSPLPPPLALQLPPGIRAQGSLRTACRRTASQNTHIDVGRRFRIARIGHRGHPRACANCQSQQRSSPWNNQPYNPASDMRHTRRSSHRAAGSSVDHRRGARTPTPGAALGGLRLQSSCRCRAARKGAVRDLRCSVPGVEFGRRAAYPPISLGESWSAPAPGRCVVMLHIRTGTASSCTPGMPHYAALCSIMLHAITRWSLP